MIEGLSEEQLNDLLSSDRFMEDYKSYEREINVDKLKNFFDDIETNKNYFRLNVKKSRRYINKNNDTNPIVIPVVKSTSTKLKKFPSLNEIKIVGARIHKDTPYATIFILFLDNDK